MLTFLITAGPTREPLDPVRYLSNRSSGLMGWALTESVLKAGHRVILVAGPVGLKPPVGVDFVPVTTAREMAEAVWSRMEGADIAILCAAVADYRPAAAAAEKIKKKADTLTVTLVKNPDILASMREKGFVGTLVGFAAETTDVERYAREKLRRKRCDLIVANDVSVEGVGFESLENEVILCYADGSLRRVERKSKAEIAATVVHETLRLHHTTL